MSRRAFFFGLLVVALLIVSLYRAKYGAKDTAAELMAVEAQIEEARQEKALLDTELSHMSRRDWIEEYAREELGMAPPKPEQMARENDLDRVIGPVVKENAVTPDAVIEVPERAPVPAPKPAPPLKAPAAAPAAAPGAMSPPIVLPVSAPRPVAADTPADPPANDPLLAARFVLPPLDPQPLPLAAPPIEAAPVAGGEAPQ
jgi:cell division protein FtsL